MAFGDVFFDLDTLEDSLNLDEDWNDVYASQVKMFKEVDGKRVATLEHDDWKPATVEEALYNLHYGLVAECEITESLNEPFIIKGEVSFLHKKENLIGEKLHFRLNMSQPDNDMKYWHGIINKWTYIGIRAFNFFKDKHKRYVYEFELIPELMFKLNKRRSRIVFPTDQDAQTSKNEDAKLSRNKLMDIIIDQLIKANSIALKDPENTERKKEMKQIAEHYAYRKEKVFQELQTRAKTKITRENKDGKMKVDTLTVPAAVEMQMTIIDAIYRENAFKNPVSKYLNYENKTELAEEQIELPEYIVQYDETDWELLQRLCREFGIYYCFEHTDVHSGIIFYTNPEKGKKFKTYEGYGKIIKEPDEIKKENLATPIIVRKGKPTPGKISAPPPAQPTQQDDKQKTKPAPNHEYLSDGNYPDADQIKALDSYNQFTLMDVKKVFKPGDPFTDSRPLFYTKLGEDFENDKYITKWHEVYTLVPDMSDLYGYNPDYDPEKRNVLLENINSDANKSSTDSSSSGSGTDSAEDSQAASNPNYYSETLTSEDKMKRHQEFYNQYKTHTEKEYHAETYRQEVSPGYKFVLTNHPDKEMNGQYYVKRVTHKMFYEKIPNSNEMKVQYYNSAVFAKIDQPFKVMPTPVRKILGVQTGIVVGGKDQQIYTNNLGQVKVYFHWDSNRKKLTEGEMLQQAIWIRVAQWGGSGNGWGGFFVPRVGQEVLISFENGNPHYPIVIGCLYNRANLPPYNLVEDEESVVSKTGIKTQSLKETQEGEEVQFNEFVFEDKADEEKIYLHAAKNFEKVIEDSETVQIVNNHSISILKGNKLLEFTGESEDNEEVVQNYTTTMKNGKISTEITKGDCQLKLTDGNKAQEITKGNYNLTLTEGDKVQKIEKGKYEIYVQDNFKSTIDGESTEEIDGDTKLTIKTGSYTILLKGGNLEISANDISHTSKGNMTIKVGGNLSFESTGNISLKAKGNLTMEGSTLSAKGSVSSEIKGGSVVKIAGALIKLN
ncbi:MAG: type VI secretion system tip protein VgrG [Alphaproteobacteria bacterium]|nr:MAG: type VI secretion system tip protein VgrG [Alphaproteobacteria bacterium]